MIIKCTLPLLRSETLPRIQFRRKCISLILLNLIYFILSVSMHSDSYTKTLKFASIISLRSFFHYIFYRHLFRKSISLVQTVNIHPIHCVPWYAFEIKCHSSHLNPFISMICFQIKVNGSHVHSLVKTIRITSQMAIANRASNASSLFRRIQILRHEKTENECEERWKHAQALASLDFFGKMKKI